MPSDLQIICHDPVLSSFELSRRGTYYPLGFPLQVETNSERVLQAFSESWDVFGKEFDETPMRVQVGVLEGAGPDACGRPAFRSREHLLSIYGDAENFMMCDFRQKFAFGWLTEQTVRERPSLRLHFLDSTVRVLAEQSYLATIHGALLARNGRGVLLCGESMAGKSTLAYACARAGWTYLSDDGTSLLRAGTDRYALGNPHTIRFRPDAKRLFPELENHLVMKRPNGKIGMEIFTRELPISTAAGCIVDHIVFLDRREVTPGRLRAHSKEHALSYLERTSSFGEENVRAAQRRTYRRLMEAEVWKLTYENLNDAIGRLNELVRDGNENL